MRAPTVTATWLSLWLVLCAGASPVGCASSAAAPGDVLYDSPFELKVGESITVGDDGVRLTFEQVVSDSRCPSDVNCIQAGEAIVALRLERADVSVEQRVSTNPARATARLDGFEVTLLSLAPYPRTDLDIAPDDYVATLRVRAAE
jgi:hypothetical protein